MCEKGRSWQEISEDVEEQRGVGEGSREGERERKNSTHLKFVSGEVYPPYERENRHLGGYDLTERPP